MARIGEGCILVIIVAITKKIKNGGCAGGGWIGVGWGGVGCVGVCVCVGGGIGSQQ